MGIHIHKVMGYGLTNARCKNHVITDSRFNPELKGKDIHSYVEGKLYQFPDWIEKNLNEVVDAVNKADGITEHSYCDISVKGCARKIMELNSICPFLTHEPEYGLPRVIVFTPIEYQNWYRCDSDIDYYEAGCVAKNKVLNLTKRCGIYPFVSMSRIPGTKPAKENMPRIIAPASYNMAVGQWDAENPLESGAVLVDLVENYRPIMPEGMMALIYYLQLFKNFQKTIQELRPMIYTYWS